MKQLLQHEADCTPVHPCNVCDLVGWLRDKLDAEDFDVFVERLYALEPTPKPRKRRNRNTTPKDTAA